MNFKEIVVANVNDFQEGQMKAFSISEDKKVLLTKVEGKIHALGETCPHYGAPLEEGILHGSRIVCPWHHACYDSRTGDLEEPPSLDSLFTFDVRIEGENVIVKVPEEIPDSRPPQIGARDSKADERVFAIIGAGAAGNAAAQTLREDGFKGRIVMITSESHRPYDRPQLSKDYLEGQSDDSALPLRPEEFYNDRDIELSLDSTVKSLAVADRTITFNDGRTLKYDSVLVATGGVPRTLDVPGSGLEGIFTLRSWDDSSAIIRACQGIRNVVIVGSSFIGIESAYSLSQRQLAVTVVGPDAVPFEKPFGKEIGILFQQLHEANGVTFKLNTTVSKFEGSRRVETVLLKSGERIPADVVILGVGVKPATDFIHGMDLLADGSVAVNEYFQAGEHVYAAGDIATFPYWYSGERLRIEHWRTAEQQGRIAGHKMTGKAIPFMSIPFFWTTQVGLYFRYVGHATDWDDIIVHGSISSKKFVAYYVKGNRVLAAAGNDTEKEMATIEELMRSNKMPAPDVLRTKSDILSIG
ncbi:FAD-dependent oxidoreductase [Desulfomonile tiedjei]|uniref:NAD(FAD)-dependent dehydrogenase n=1 Tax=Desulfomonile tiedjei (strain ATCC 49306 / DSM 6799 / DCB-1) TaxID=706587 RepID=I4C334_DESTA|nr:FAD-dependent oxidoreductase [Desulfomonile tiedjei]AFM23975.1 NAD(FAD)-dependent dehydrogenase [Desulfomonile tiedjei DSM 6799]